MRYDEGADLDTSSVEDVRGGGGFGGRGVAFGGGGLGLVGVVIYILIQVLGGSDGGNGAGVAGFPAIDQGRSANNDELAQECRTGADANSSVECAVVADINSIQDYWGQVLGPRYMPAAPCSSPARRRPGAGRPPAAPGPSTAPRTSWSTST